MSLEYYLGALLPSASSVKEDFDTLGELNTQEAILETHSNDRTMGDVTLDVQDLPLKISLTVRLRPQSLLEMKGNYSISFNSRGIVYLPLTLEEIPSRLMKNCCAAIDLIWEGEGSQQGENGLVDRLCEELQGHEYGCLHTKVFSLPPGNSFFSKEIYTHEGEWVYECSLWETPRLEEHPLIPLGGFFHKGLDPEKMMPMYGRLDSDYPHTSLSIKAQSYWERAGCYVGERGYLNGRYYSFVPLSTPLVQTSLAQDIKGGKIQFGSPETLYVSYDYDFIDPETNTILLHLKQQG